MFVASYWPKNYFVDTYWPPIVTIATVPTKQYESIFEALNDKIFLSPVNTIIQNFNTGFILEKTKLPYMSLSMQSSINSEVDSCNNRISESIFDFTIFSRNSEDLNETTINLNNLFDLKSLNLKNSIFVSMEKIEQSIEELIPGIWRGKFILLIKDQIQIITNPMNGSGSNIQEALQDIYNKSLTLKSMSNDFVFGFQKEKTNLPFINLSGIKLSENSRSTCERLVSSELQIVSTARTDILANLIGETVKNHFDRASITLDDNIFSLLDWNFSSLLEPEPGIWQRTDTFEYILQENL